MRLAGPAHILEGQALVVEQRLGELVHPVPLHPARVEVEGHHERVVQWSDDHAMTNEHGQVIFEIVPDLEHAGVLQQRLQSPADLLERQLVRPFGEQTVAAGLVIDRNVAGAPSADAQADADQSAGHAVQAIGLRVDSHHAEPGRLCDPAV